VNSHATEILIVGGGPAGMSAALAASSRAGTTVTVVDDNPRLGGQIWRAEMGKIKSPEAGRLISALDTGSIRVINNAQVFGRAGDDALLAETPAGTIELKYKNLIIAAGARERFLPFPGWTESCVFGAAGLQALVKGGLDVKGKKIIVAGTGPLLLAAAQYLRSKGARIMVIAEQAPAASLRKFVRRLWRTPAKLAQAIALRLKLIGVPYLTDSWIVSMGGGEPFRVVTLTCNGKLRTSHCDMVACGFNLVPNIELALALGCEVKSGFVVTDEFQRTSCENIFCAGEPCSIGGVEASLVEGRIAGLAATGQETLAREMFAERDKTSSFAKLLATTFSLRNDLKDLAGDSNIVCRCEDVEYGRLKHFESFREAKLQTRLGMGQCQGRVCGAACDFLFGWEQPGVRPPIFPVRLENL
jgi:D-hydroxyproline dehydrogenase subunit alpha